MDVVITYVDGRDAAWRASYEATVGAIEPEKRFRDWGTLKYLLRGVERFMPFVEKVHLVVASEGQVPAWVDRGTVDVVLHGDIIPAEFLPTFNSTAIEMFLHRIPGLSEEYLYFNDDMFPVSPMEAEEFFEDGQACVGMARHVVTGNHLYRLQTRNSDRLARKAAGLRPSPVFLRPQHTASPMLRSCCEEVFQACEQTILESISRTREPQNLNQYLFCDYQFHTGRAMEKRISNRHFSLATASVGKICEFLRNPTSSIACINDVRMSDSVFESTRAALLDAFEGLLPDKSKFEL